MERFDDRQSAGRSLAQQLAGYRADDVAVLAAPIGVPDTLAGLAEVADEVVCLGAPDDFVAVGQGYRDFGQTSDEEVCALLAQSPGQ